MKRKIKNVFSIFFSFYLYGGKLCENGCQFVVNCLLTELDLSHVKTSDTNDAVVFVDHSWSFPLSLG